jgi:hypothetical protein
VVMMATDTHVVFLQEGLRVVVRINCNLGHRVVDRRIGLTLLNTGLEPRENQFETVTLLDFVNQLVDREGSGNRVEQVLDGGFVAVNIQKTSNNLRGSGGIDLLNVDFNEAGEVVLVEVENQIMDHVETVTDNDERKLIRHLGFLEEVLNLFGIVVVALSADPLDLSNLTGSGSGLDVLEMDLLVLTEVDDRSKVVVKT